MVTPDNRQQSVYSLRMANCKWQRMDRNDDTSSSAMEPNWTTDIVMSITVISDNIPVLDSLVKWRIEVKCEAK